MRVGNAGMSAPDLLLFRSPKEHFLAEDTPGLWSTSQIVIRRLIRVEKRAKNRKGTYLLCSTQILFVGFEILVLPWTSKRLSARTGDVGQCLYLCPCL